MKSSGAEIVFYSELSIHQLANEKCLTTASPPPWDANSGLVNEELWDLGINKSVEWPESAREKLRQMKGSTMLMDKWELNPEWNHILFFQRASV